MLHVFFCKVPPCVLDAVSVAGSVHASVNVGQAVAPRSTRKRTHRVHGSAASGVRESGGGGSAASDAADVAISVGQAAVQDAVVWKGARQAVAGGEEASSAALDNAINAGLAAVESAVELQAALEAAVADTTGNVNASSGSGLTSDNVMPMTLTPAGGRCKVLSNKQNFI